METGLSSCVGSGKVDTANGSWFTVDFDPLQRSPLELAYLGDTVFDLIVRTRLVCEANEPVNKLNRKASAVVNANSQSRMVEVLEPLFTEEEAAVYHRGRNAKAATHAKNASIQDYRRATGLEAVFGYLYLKNRYARILELFDTALLKQDT